MAESFINQVKRTSSIKIYEYEDFLIKGEVKNAKNMITKAIKVQKSHITWCYAHDDYDNFTSLRNDIVVLCQDLVQVNMRFSPS